MMMTTETLTPIEGNCITQEIIDIARRNIDELSDETEVTLATRGAICQAAYQGFNSGVNVSISSVYESREADIKVASKFAAAIIASEKKMTDAFLISRTATLVGTYLTGLVLNRTKQQLKQGKAN